MNASDIMTSKVITVGPDADVAAVAKLLTDNRISALPVVDRGRVVGIVSEGDLLRRVETGTAPASHRPRWLSLFSGDVDALDYVRSHARKAAEVMSRGVVTVADHTPVAEVAAILESRGIKRVPVLRDGTLVGIVCRSNLLQAMASRRQSGPVSTATDDRTIRDTLLREISDQPWTTPDTNVIVEQGVVHLWGIVQSEEQRRALIVAAENTQGVKGVEDHMGTMPVVVF